MTRTCLEPQRNCSNTVWNPSSSSAVNTVSPCFSGTSHSPLRRYRSLKLSTRTGAGDSFAGGFIGYISASADTTPATIRRAAIVGSVMASFTVEAFGLERLASLSADDIRKRFDEFIDLTRFESQNGGSGLPLRAEIN